MVVSAVPGRWEGNCRTGERKPRPRSEKIFGSFAPGSVIMMLRLPLFHRRVSARKRREPQRHHIQKYAVCPNQSAGSTAPGRSRFLTSKRGVSVEGKHHTRTTIAPLKHEKSLFIFDRLPTFNGRASAPHKQTVRVGVHRRPAAAALAVSWITGNAGAAVGMAH